MDCSIIIATYNRCDVLETCLRALSNQKTKFSFEVIVVDDGSTDDTKKIAESFGDELKLSYIYQENKGQGNARNNGIQKANGEVIMFINDDIIVNDNFVEEHLKIHEANPEETVAVLGFIDWHPDINISPFMLWLTNGSSVLGKFGGHQFAFEKLEGKDEADYNFFYTSNISIKKSLLLKDMFSPEFNFYGWEDIELGYRLHKRHGLRLLYNPKAVGYHHHEIDIDSFKRRMEMIGASVHIFDKMHPELKKSPSWLKETIFRALGSRPITSVLGVLKGAEGGVFFDLYYYALSKRHFLKGYIQNK